MSSLLAYSSASYLARPILPVRDGLRERPVAPVTETDRQDRTPPGVATKANPPKGGDAKLRGYQRRVPPMPVGLPNESSEGACCRVHGVWNSCSP
jgi:hypothetical protein